MAKLNLQEWRKRRESEDKGPTLEASCEMTDTEIVITLPRRLAVEELRANKKGNPLVTFYARGPMTFEIADGESDYFPAYVSGLALNLNLRAGEPPITES